MVAKLGVEGKPWTDGENDLLVADYMRMLADDLAGRHVQKTARRVELQKVGLGARSLKSIEAKQQNLSAVLALLGYRHVVGLKPLENYQDALVDALSRDDHLTSLRRMSVGDMASPPMPPIPAKCDFVSAPAASSKVLPPGLAALVRKTDPAERDRRARELGRAGEAFVVDFERKRLHDHGQGDLVGDVRWVADTEGDGHGYDVRSFDRQGRELHIEVKTTNGGPTTPFMLTSNEAAVSSRDANWTLYRVHRFYREPRIFKLDPPLHAKAAMETAVWKVSPGRMPVSSGIR